MKKIIGFVVLILLCQLSFAQYTVRLVVNEAATKELDDWYIAGPFNNWNAGDAAYKLKPFGNKRKAIVLQNLPAGNIQFKFTRGSWDKVETAANGADIENREIDVHADTIVYIRVAGWKDDYPLKPKPNTAGPQVKVIDTAFVIPQLNRTRRIWIYVPKSYASSKKSYPVLYMNDGQNLFNEQTAAYGEWGVDEALDTLEKSNQECIVVGIDHGGDKRLNEYNPYDNDKFGKGEGEKYTQFIVETLKPYIDKKYRTLKDSTHTYIAGSSMGGLITLYAIEKYPRVFGAAGIFSPSFWTAPPIYNEAASTTSKTMHRYYFYAGGKEGDNMISDMDKMIDVVSKHGFSETRRVVAPTATHSETAWRQEFPDFYRWLLK